MAEVPGSLRNRLSLIPYLAILLWWVIRLSTTGRLSFEAGITLGVLSHFGLLIASSLTPVFQGVESPHFIDGFKHSLRPAALYAMLAAVSTVAFHHVVQKQATELRQLERERFIAQQLGSDASYAALQAEDPQLAQLSREDARQRAMESLRFQFNPLWHFTASLLLWIAAAMSTSFFMSLLGRWLRAWPS